MELLLRPANDSVRRMSTIEVALKVRPSAAAGAAAVWRLDPQYGQWAAREFPGVHFCYCPLGVYDLHVRPADARYTLEEMDARLRAETERSGGYLIPELARWRTRTAMFAVGGVRLKPLLEFLFAWG